MEKKKRKKGVEIALPFLSRYWEQRKGGDKERDCGRKGKRGKSFLISYS